jgi:peptidoglycan/LPS O-acetylase OafA/YrhL
MRGIAAFGIMSFHLFLPSIRIFSGFNTLVDFFFVLSGFVLAPKILYVSKVSKRQFIIKRALRIFPMLIPLFCTLLLTQKFPPISNHMNNIPNANLLQYLGAFLLLQVFWSSLTKLNAPLWSLSAEWLINLFAIFWSPKRFFPIIVSIGLIAEASGIYLNNRFELHWGVISYLIAIGRVTVGFYLGIMLRIKQIEHPKNSSKKILLFSLFIFGMNFYLYGFSDYFVIFAAPICWFIVGEVAKIDETTIPKSILRTCAYLGKISYGVYVWHATIGWINIPTFFVKHLPITFNHVEEEFFNTIGTITIVVLAVELSIKFIEGPITRLGTSRFF